MKDVADTLPDDFLRDIASRHDWFNYQIADFKSEQGRPIFTAFLSDPKSKPTNSTKLRVWLQAAIHGNEPAADQGAMALLGKMDANATWAASLLEKMDIFVMPRYNPDGVHYFQRYFLTIYHFPPPRLTSAAANSRPTSIPTASTRSWSNNIHRMSRSYSHPSTLTSPLICMSSLATMCTVDATATVSMR
jgi:hypothetical protein